MKMNGCFSLNISDGIGLTEEQVKELISDNAAPNVRIVDALPVEGLKLNRETVWDSFTVAGLAGEGRCEDGSSPNCADWVLSVDRVKVGDFLTFVNADAYDQNIRIEVKDEDGAPIRWDLLESASLDIKEGTVGSDEGPRRYWAVLPGWAAVTLQLVVSGGFKTLRPVTMLETALKNIVSSNTRSLLDLREQVSDMNRPVLSVVDNTGTIKNVNFDVKRINKGVITLFENPRATTAGESALGLPYPGNIGDKLQIVLPNRAGLTFRYRAFARIVNTDGSLGATLSSSEAAWAGSLPPGYHEFVAIPRWSEADGYYKLRFERITQAALT